MKKKIMAGFVCAMVLSSLFPVGVLHAQNGGMNTMSQEATVKNLISAYNGESNAHNRYLAFAKKADEEGYGSVASLFRATARAEEIHAKNHAEVIKKLGGAVPEVELAMLHIGSTKENLEAAIKGETYERDTMYPDFVNVARATNIAAAIRTFNYALAAEIEHEKLYSQTLNNLSSLQGQKQVYYVCPVCGYTTATLPASKCPVCYTPKEKFELVS